MAHFFGDRDAAVTALRTIANLIELQPKESIFRVEVNLVMVDSRHGEFAKQVNQAFTAPSPKGEDDE